MSEAQSPQPHEPAGHPEQHIYTREFKLEAVRLSDSSEKTVAQIARDLGVPERVLYRWRHELREQQEKVFPGKGHQRASWRRRTAACAANWTCSSRSARY